MKPYRPRIGDRVYMRLRHENGFNPNVTGVVYYYERKHALGIPVMTYRVGFDWVNFHSNILLESEVSFKATLSDEELLTHVCEKVRNIVLKHRRKKYNE